MKKLISILMIVAMIASIAAVNTGAAGQVLFTDTFEGDELNPTNWIVDGNLFYVEEGWCKGWADAVVNQSYYYDEENRPDGNKNWATFCAQVDIAYFDFDRDGDDHWAGFWWKDYVVDEETGEDGQGTTYNISLHIESRQITIDMGGDFLPEDHENPVAVCDLPEDYEIKVDASNPTIAKLGIRITPNLIEVFLDGQKMLDYVPAASIGTMKDSPLLLWNNGMYVGFDNLIVATADYDGLFASADPNPPADDNNNDVTPPADDNNDVTPPADDNNDVTPPADDNNNNNDNTNNDNDNNNNNQQQNKPADTNQGANNQQPSTGTQTGDAAIVVLAVMIVALGTAIAVKKVSVK